LFTTEDEEIADVSKQWGAEVPFLRPKKFAGDTSGIGDAISYTIKKLGKGYSDAGSIAKYYMGSCLTGGLPTHILLSILPMP
jgi:CMP-N-acetylneuraminic acid synthetase